MPTAEEFPNKADLFTKYPLVNSALRENKFVGEYPKFVLSRRRYHTFPLLV